jgi:hypothetical protein
MNLLKPLKWAGVGVGALAAVLASAQLVQPESPKLRTEPSHTIQATLPASSALGPVLERACGDCHSNTPPSGWYARVSPLSFIIARGASEGRMAVNFSEWTGYASERKRALLLASCADARSGRMPVAAYTRLRPEAKLSAQDVETICEASR